MDTRYGRVRWGVNGTRVRTKTWAKPRLWNRRAFENGVRYRVFCASLADVFEDRPELIEWRRQLFKVIDDTPHLDWLLLTKRPENIIDMWPNVAHRGKSPRKNVWLGTSVSDQEAAKKALHLFRVRHLSPVLFLSVEPLIGPVNLRRIPTPNDNVYDLISGAHCTDSSMQVRVHNEIGFVNPSIDWVIVGGESGRHSRLCKYEWVLDVVTQCHGDAKVWVKQLGTNSDIEVGTGKREELSLWPRGIQKQELPVAQ